MKINMYYRPLNGDTFNNKPLYHGFPRNLSGKQDVAEQWATQNDGTCWMSGVDNQFDDVHIMDKTSVRGWRGSSNVIQVAVYVSDIDAYVKLDMRLNGLLDIMTNHNILKGKFDCSVGINFKSGNYYVVPLSKVEHDKPKPKQSTPKIKPIEGELYTLSHNSIEKVMYLGEYTFENGSIDPTNVDVSGRKCHVFFNKWQGRDVINVYMSVPKISLVVDGDKSKYNHPITITTKYGTIKQYGFNGDGVEVDTNKKSVKILKSSRRYWY